MVQHNYHTYMRRNVDQEINGRWDKTEIEFYKKRIDKEIETI